MDGYFTDRSMLRRIHRERALALSGPRSLLMQAAHPLAVSGLLAHSSALDEPYDRLARTAEVLSTIGFGPRAEADRMTGTVRAMHRRVRGTLKEDAGPFPAGTPYRADDPELLMWILFTLVDSALVVYRMYVGHLSEREQAAYWEDQKVVGRLFGLRVRDMPDTLADLRAYRRDMLEGDTLHVTDWARRRARAIVLAPPVPWMARPLLETVNFITIALLPDGIRRGYGLSPIPPAAVRRAVVAGNAEYVKRAVIPLLPERLRLTPQSRAASRLDRGLGARARGVGSGAGMSSRRLTEEGPDEVGSLSRAELIEQFDGGTGRVGDEADRYEELACELARRGERDLLARHLADPRDGPRVFAAARALAGVSGPGGDRSELVSRLRRLLDDARPDIVAAAIDGLTALGDNHSRELIEPLLSAGDPSVRTRALLYQAHVVPQDARSALVHGLDDPDATVRFTALDQLDDLEEVHGRADYRPLFEQALHDADSDVREHAKYILEHHFPIAKSPQ